MPTFVIPATDAAEAAEALRGLAHATSVFDRPATSYEVLGDLSAGLHSLRQVLEQLARLHADANVPSDSRLSAEERLADGQRTAAAAATNLLGAVQAVAAAAALVDLAHADSSRLVWPVPGSAAVE